MFYRNILLYWSTIALWLLSACTPNNVPLGPNTTETETGNGNTIEIEVAREGVFTVQGDQRQALPLSERVALVAGQGVAVDENGRAIVHFGNLLTVEVLQAGQLQVQHFSVDEQAATILARQDSGILIADLGPSQGIDNRFTVQTAFATITAGSNARFVVVRETSGLLEWVLALEADQDDLQITAGGVTKSLVGGQARWIAPMGEPGPVVVVTKGVEAWLSGVRNSASEPGISEVLLPPANMLADTSSLTTLPAPGQAVELRRDVQGAINLTLDQHGIFGAPGYTLEDCNGDGALDIAILNGVLRLDFGDVQARVQAIDVTVFNRGQPGYGSLQGLDLAKNELGRQRVEVGGGALQTLGLRTNHRYHYAELVAGNACFLGVSLTPLSVAGEPVQPPPIAPNIQSNEVVNVLASTAERLPENGEFQAPFAGADDGTSQIQIDGNQSDWDALAGEWTLFSTITHNANCATRYPDSGNLVDLEGQVRLAYDTQNLYVTFMANDDGVTTYTGTDERYFLGDSPQLLLDLDLNGDFNDAQLSGDDIQIDLLPNVDAPKAALWQLSTLSSRPFPEAPVAAARTETGYFVEAAFPWQSLGVIPQPGDRLGIVASISDNDTPDANAQECIISTAPQREWRNPTTWGTALLKPAE